MNARPIASDYEKALREIYALSHWLCPDYESLFTDAQEIAGKALAAAREQPAPAQEAVAWLITLSTGTRAVHLHNAIGDYRTLDPAATVAPLYAAPPARDPSVSVAELMELVEKWMKEYERGRDQHARYQKRTGEILPVSDFTEANTFADELKALCDRAAEEKGT